MRTLLICFAVFTIANIECYPQKREYSQRHNGHDDNARRSPSNQDSLDVGNTRSYHGTMPRGWFTSQSRSTYNLREGAKETARAEAESSLFGSKATVRSSNGEGHVQSETQHRPSCKDCEDNGDDSSRPLLSNNQKPHRTFKSQEPLSSQNHHNYNPSPSHEIRQKGHREPLDDKNIENIYSQGSPSRDKYDTNEDEYSTDEVSENNPDGSQYQASIPRRNRYGGTGAQQSIHDKASPNINKYEKTDPLVDKHETTEPISIKLAEPDIQRGDDGSPTNGYPDPKIIENRNMGSQPGQNLNFHEALDPQGEAYGGVGPRKDSYETSPKIDGTGAPVSQRRNSGKPVLSRGRPQKSGPKVTSYGETDPQSGRHVSQSRDQAEYDKSGGQLESTGPPTKTYGGNYPQNSGYVPQRGYPKTTGLTRDEHDPIGDKINSYEDMKPQRGSHDDIYPDRVINAKTGSIKPAEKQHIESNNRGSTGPYINGDENFRNTPVNYNHDDYEDSENRFDEGNLPSKSTQNTQIPIQTKSRPGIVDKESSIDTEAKSPGLRNTPGQHTTKKNNNGPTEVLPEKYSPWSNGGNYAPRRHSLEHQEPNEETNMPSETPQNSRQSPRIFTDTSLSRIPGIGYRADKDYPGTSKPRYNVPISRNHNYQTPETGEQPVYPKPDSRQKDTDLTWNQRPSNYPQSSRPNKNPTFDKTRPSSKPETYSSAEIPKETENDHPERDPTNFEGNFPEPKNLHDYYSHTTFAPDLDSKNKKIYPYHSNQNRFSPNVNNDDQIKGSPMETDIKQNLGNVNGDPPLYRDKNGLYYPSNRKPSVLSHRNNDNSDIPNSENESPLKSLNPYSNNADKITPSEHDNSQNPSLTQYNTFKQEQDIYEPVSPDLKDTSLKKHSPQLLPEGSSRNGGSSVRYPTVQNHPGGVKQAARKPNTNVNYNPLNGEGDTYPENNYNRPLNSNNRPSIAENNPSPTRGDNSYTMNPPPSTDFKKPENDYNDGRNYESYPSDKFHFHQPKSGLPENTETSKPTQDHNQGDDKYEEPNKNMQTQNNKPNFEKDYPYDNNQPDFQNEHHFSNRPDYHSMQPSDPQGNSNANETEIDSIRHNSDEEYDFTTDQTLEPEELNKDGISRKLSSPHDPGHKSKNHPLKDPALTDISGNDRPKTEFTINNHDREETFMPQDHNNRKYQSTGDEEHKPLSGKDDPYDEILKRNNAHSSHSEGRPNSEDSQAVANITRINNITAANAFSYGRNEHGDAGVFVSGSFSGHGSFSAQAHIFDNGKEAQSEVLGSWKDVISSARGRGGNSLSQAKVQLESTSGLIKTDGHTDGLEQQTDTIMQGSYKGGEADARADGFYPAKSETNIGVTPAYRKTRDSYENGEPFYGSGAAAARGNPKSGFSRTHLDGNFRHGISYGGKANAEAGNEQPDSRIRNGFQENKRNGFNINNEYGEEPPELSRTYRSQFPRQEHDENLNLLKDKTEMLMQRSDTLVIDSKLPKEEKKHSTLVLPLLHEGFVGDPLTPPPRSSVDLNKIYEAGEEVPGTNGYRIPIGFRGRVKPITELNAKMPGLRVDGDVARVINTSPNGYGNSVPLGAHTSSTILSNTHSKKSLNKPCGYLTYHCYMVYGPNGRTKTCTPIAITTADGVEC